MSKGKAAYRKWEDCVKSSKAYSWSDSGADYKTWHREHDDLDLIVKPQSKQKGVTYDLETGKWLVRVSRVGFIGRFVEEEDAIVAAKANREVRDAGGGKAQVKKFSSGTTASAKFSKPGQEQLQAKGKRKKPPAEDTESDESEADSDVDCEVCAGEGDEEKMLLCDSCPAAYHIYCLDPPLTRVPEGDWVCPGCVASWPPQQPMPQQAAKAPPREPPAAAGGDECPLCNEGSGKSTGAFFRAQKLVCDWSWLTLMCACDVRASRKAHGFKAAPVGCEARPQERLEEAEGQAGRSC